MNNLDISIEDFVYYTFLITCLHEFEGRPFTSIQGRSNVSNQNCSLVSDFSPLVVKKCVKIGYRKSHKRNRLPSVRDTCPREEIFPVFSN